MSELSPHNIQFKKYIYNNESTARELHDITEDEYIRLTEQVSYHSEYHRATVFKNGSKHITLTAVEH